MSCFKLVLLLCSLLTGFGFAQTFPEPTSIAVSDDTLNTIAKPELKFNDYWFALDKGQHLIGSMILTVGTASTLYKYTDTNKNDSKIYSVGFTFFIGLGKEVWDSGKKNNQFSYKDLCANMAGILLGLTILNIE